jgi:fatty-acyl-CoA synthase
MALRSNTLVTKDWVRALGLTQRLRDAQLATGDSSFARVVHDFATTQGAAPALIGEHNENLTYAELSQRANRYARWALNEGLAVGDVVALDLANRPEYVAMWLGLSQVGCVAALINTHLGEEAKAYSLGVAGAKRTIDAAHLPAADRLSGAPLTRDEWRPPRPQDHALLIYTSGTTGLPKATVVTNARVLEWGGWFAGIMEVASGDRLYDCLPMYHSVGGVAAVGSMLVAGGAVIVRERFSPNRFWRDVAESGATIVQYIGELGRYLLNAPASHADTQHKVRIAVGNGLAADVWEPFRKRFRIPRILEFYAASEGAVSFTNCEEMPGALGRVPTFLRDRFPVALVKVDLDTAEPVRDANGRCQTVGVGEPGEAIGKLGGGARFDGYTDPKATEAKILQDVFVSGDRWYRTGDLLRQDAAGFYYFVDRLGDTFRWKGENVSTAEVAQVICACPGVRAAAVYGVRVPGADGKAGMAAIVVEEGAFDHATLHAHLVAKLPAYARPMFVRLCPAFDSTGTFRVRKADLVREGYEQSSDPVWFDDRTHAQFLPYDRKLLADGARA